MITGDGRSLGCRLKEEIVRELQRLALAMEQLAQVEAERDRVIREAKARLEKPAVDCRRRERPGGGADQVAQPTSRGVQPRRSHGSCAPLGQVLIIARLSDRGSLMLKKTSKLLPLLAGALSDPLFVVDVGCSGGLEPALRQFEPKLAGIGFDSLVAEVARLAATETNPNIQYVEAWVDSDGSLVSTDDPGHWWWRSSACAVEDLKR